MRIISALPLLLLPLTVAHAHSGPGPLQPAHHPARRLNGPRSGRIVERQQSGGGLFGDLVNDDEDVRTTATSSALKSGSGSGSGSSSTRSTISTPPSTSSPGIILTTGKNEDTTIGTTSRVTSTSSPLTSATGVSSVASASASQSSSTSTGSSQAPSSSSSSTVVANVTSTATEAPTSTQASSTDPSAASVQTSVNEEGQTQLVTVVLTQAAEATDAASSASATSDKKDDGDAIPTAAIIGISVGAGVVVLVLIAFAVWRMKRRTGDEDEAIRWPELNRHGDSDAHHALPARQTGQHGFETNPLSRSLSNSSSIFAPSNVGLQAPHSAGPVPMALNGSGFGATSSLEDEYSEKHAASYDDHENYTSLPPPVAHHTALGEYAPSVGQRSAGPDDDEDPYAGVAMSMADDTHVSLPNPHSPSHLGVAPGHGSGNGGYRLE